MTNSKRLKRLVTDLASESSFRTACDRMREHHDVYVPASIARELTMDVAGKAEYLLSKEKPLPEGQIPNVLIMEMDGVMVPVVDSEESEDRRKSKQLFWKEMRVGAIQDPDCLRARYASSFKSPRDLGKKMGTLLRKVAGKEVPKIHGVGDGARWIKEQGEIIGGSQYTHLIDYYHFCQYLYAAFEDNVRKELMVKRCKSEVKSGKISKVLRRLRREEKKNQGNQGVRSCLRYILNRPGEFEYAKAISRDLPIGSGMIESANRSLVQKRLKLPGAWWLQRNAEKMAQLRVLRANNGWEMLWKDAA